jgi:hypothetical protein
MLKAIPTAAFGSIWTWAGEELCAISGELPELPRLPGLRIAEIEGLSQLMITRN